MTAAVHNAGYSHREIWRIAAPMILSAVSTPLVGLVDTALMGHLDDAAFLAATAAGATMFSVLFMSLNFLRMGTTGVAAQAYGSGASNTIVSSLTQPLVFSIALALALLVLQRPTIELGLWLIGLSEGAGALATEYYRIRIWSAPMALANFVIIGWLIGMQNARGPLAMLLTINIINATLDFVFVIDSIDEALRWVDGVLARKKGLGF